MELPLTLVSSRFAIEEEEIKFGGKVVWDKDQIEVKRPLKILLNILDYKGVELLAVFLHECGHVTDRDNPNIKLKSKESEVSAWRHAISDFKKVLPPEYDEITFNKVVHRSLVSYKIQMNDIEGLFQNHFRKKPQGRYE